jgi:tyrosinase
MAVVRGNILTSPHAQTFLTAAVTLSRLSTGVTAAQLNQNVPQQAPGARIFGPPAEMGRPLSWWDLFTWWHVATMSWPTTGGNRAHQGPVFLPWHRLYLRRLEQAIQAVSRDPDAALPYWDWTTDGGLPAAAQLSAPVWSLLGPPRGQVTTGPLAQFRVRLTQAEDRLVLGPPRPIWRDAARGIGGLPSPDDQAWTLADGLYDGPPWDPGADSFRNKAEGWQDPREDLQRLQPHMHNRVHVWVGGDMAPGSSPNDPVFFLNHCFVDKIWSDWQAAHPEQSYLPATGDANLRGIDDPMEPWVKEGVTPRSMLDHSQYYTYA